MSIQSNVNVLDETVTDAQGQTQSLSSYKGNVLLIVNVASKCGNTPQYAGLESLYEKYQPQGFTVLGFPCNQFGSRAMQLRKEGRVLNRDSASTRSPEQSSVILAHHKVSR